MFKYYKKIVSVLCCSILVFTSFLSVSAKGSNDVYVGQSLQSDTTVNENISSDNLPSYYNGVELGFVTTPKDQKTLNTCWAFVGTSILESYLLKNDLGYYDFSEEHLNVWATTRYNDTGWLRNYYDGGYSRQVAGYLTSFSGGAPEELYPYGTMSSYTYSDLKKPTVEYGVTELMYVSQDINTVKNSVYNYGSVYANCSINPKFFNSNKTAFNADETLSSSNLSGHVVAIVGWDDDYSKENFNPKHKPENNGAWLVKNSWGTQSNDNGFFWISYEDKYLLSKTFGYSYAIREVEKIGENDKLFQHDEFGATYNMTLFENIDGNAVYDKELTFINVFDFSKEDRILNNVIFESESVGGEYTAYLTPVENDKPVEDRSKWTKIDNGIIEYSGYHSIEANGLDLPLDKCGIAVEIDTTNIDTKAGIGISETLFNSSINRITFRPDPEKNEGFIIRDGQMYEFLDFYTDVLNDYNNTGNITIKAYTSLDDILLGDVNDDGGITISDVLLLQMHITEIDLGEFKINETNADVNKDNKTNIADVLLIQKTLSKQ